MPRFLLLMAPVLFLAPVVSSQTPRPRTEAPSLKLEPVAEVKVLMEGLTKPNLDGIARVLQKKSIDAEGWRFARGQALLIAETGNLLMMRPPKTRPAQDEWLTRSAELRTAAGELARAAGNKDYLTARTKLATLANACNRCHQEFRVATRVAPDAPPD